MHAGGIRITACCQSVTGKFPKARNREFKRHNREFIRRIRELPQVQIPGAKPTISYSGFGFRSDPRVSGCGGTKPPRIDSANFYLKQVIEMMRGFVPPSRLLADKIYDANWLRDLLAGQGAEAVIP